MGWESSGHPGKQGLAFEEAEASANGFKVNKLGETGIERPIKNQDPAAAGIQL